MSQQKYTDGSGVAEIWANTKNYIASQLLGKSNVGHTHSASDITSGLATVATSGSYNDLSNKPTIPTVNNATLTIQKNGTTVGTFSANQATDETINIEVPDVNNGTLTIQQNGTTVDTFTANSSSDKTVNIQCVDLSSNQTVGGNKEFTGTTTAHDVIPSATDTYNFGSPSYQWNNAYIKSLTINGVACGDILTHNVSEFVDVSSNQTIGGQKIFSTSPRVTKTFPDIALNISDCDVTEIPTEVKYASLYFRDKNNKNLAYIVGQRRVDGIKRMCIRTHRTNDIDAYYSVDLDSNGNFYPEQNNAINLGTFTNKWKSFNGINPGALSLPSNSYVNVDTTDWDLTCQNELMGSFTPTADGWLMLHVSNSGTNEVNFWIIGGVIRINNKSTLNEFNNDNFNMLTIPVEKDKTYNIYGNASEYVAGRSIAYCRFMPCRGNV